MTNTKKIGALGEDIACRYLENHGYTVLERNFHGGRFSELDIVATDKAGYLCFIEVKYRESDMYGGIEGAIDHKKIKKICGCARYFLSSKKIPDDTPIRFDVVSIIGDRIELIENAFDYTM